MIIDSLSSRPTIADVHALYRDRAATVTDVYHHFLSVIEREDELVGAMLRVEREFGLQGCARLDRELELNSIDELVSQQSLFGIPFVLKDNVMVEGLVATSASKILEGYVATYSSDVYELLSSAGGVLLGFANQDEFAFGSSTEHSAYCKTVNPVDHSRVPGGSSGGPAAAVAADMCVFSIGTDTGGSVRQPASFCGIVASRPTYGQFSRFGVMSAASSFDQPGVFSQNVSDNHIVSEVLSAYTNNDAKQIDSTIKSESKLSKRLKIGIPKEYYAEGVDQGVLSQIENIKSEMGEGVEFVDISLPSTDYNVAAYYILMTVESSSNLERYDGVRYGPQASDLSEDPEMFYTVRDGLFGEEVKRRIMLGTYASSAGYYDAFYNKAAAVREKIKMEFEEAFKTVDYIITPVTPTPAFKFGENSDDPIKMYLADIMTLSPALAQNVSMSVPIGNIDYDGSKLPVGLQIIGPSQSEAEVYELSRLVESKVK